MAFSARDLGVKLAETEGGEGCGYGQSAAYCREPNCQTLTDCTGTGNKPCPQRSRQGGDSPDDTHKGASHLAGLELLRERLRESLGGAAR